MDPKEPNCVNGKLDRHGRHNERINLKEGKAPQTVTFVSFRQLPKPAEDFYHGLRPGLWIENSLLSSSFDLSKKESFSGYVGN